LLKDFDELPKNIDLFKSFHPDSIRFSELTNVACDVLTSVPSSRQVSNFIVDHLYCAIKIEPPWRTVAHMTTTCPVIGLQRCTVAESYYI
jgi:hypothetical protein